MASDESGRLRHERDREKETRGREPVPDIIITKQTRGGHALLGNTRHKHRTQNREMDRT